MTTANCFNDKFEYDYAGLVEGLNRYLRLKATPIGLKRFKTVAEMEAVPKVRHPDPAEKIAMDQVVGQTRWIGYTLGITMDNLMGAQCGAVVGLHPRSEEWLAGERMNGVWYGTLKDSAAHQAAMTCASYGDYEALVTSPLTSGRIDNPDICLIYMTPGQMITFINGLQHVNYKKYEFSCVGESACADSWGNTFGRVGDTAMQTKILRAALDFAVTAADPGILIDLPLEWDEDFVYFAGKTPPEAISKQMRKSPVTGPPGR